MRSRGNAENPVRRGQHEGEPGAVYGSVIVLNDMGGRMGVSDKTWCLRAEDHFHPPIVCAAFMGGQGAKARSIAYCDDGTTPTLKSVLSGGNTVPDVVYCFEPMNMKDENRGGRNLSEVCYAIYPVCITSRSCRSNPKPGDPCPTLTTDCMYYLVGRKDE